nr:hypothetical protein [Tanacetum cinerariifolium]
MLVSNDGDNSRHLISFSGTYKRNILRRKNKEARTCRVHHGQFIGCIGDRSRVHGVHDEKHVRFEVELQVAHGNHKTEDVRVSNDDAAVAQRRLEDKQLEEMTNTDCLVKEQEKVHLGKKVRANIMVTGVPGQEDAEGNIAEKKKVNEYVEANLGKLLKLTISPNVEVSNFKLLRTWFDDVLVGEPLKADNTKCWTGLHEMAMAAFKSQYIDKDTYSASAKDIQVKSPWGNVAGRKKMRSKKAKLGNLLKYKA